MSFLVAQSNKPPELEMDGLRAREVIAFNWFVVPRQQFVTWMLPPCLLCLNMFVVGKGVVFVGLILYLANYTFLSIPMNVLKPFQTILEVVGKPTAESSEQLRMMKLDCEERKDPNSFYLTFKLSDPPVINWSHNSDRHLGVDELDYEQYYSRIHPVWFPLHIAFGTVGYLIGRRLFGANSEEWASYTINVPLKDKNGDYHWYNQVSIPATFDRNRKLISHLNQYHRLCPFDRLVPSKPKMNFKDEWMMGLDKEFAKAGNAALDACLSPLLTSANQRIVQTYRRLTKMGKHGAWVSPAKKEVREALGMSGTAINKANVRIIQSLKGSFPESVTRDVAGFAAWLNDLCGHPEG